MNAQSPINAAERDKAAYAQVDNVKLNEMLAYAARKSGRSVLQIGKEFSQMNRSFRMINISEYIRWGLFDPDRHDEAQRNAFISNDAHWPIVHSVNPRSWQSTAEDKVIAATILNAGGVPVPDSVGVIDKSQRLYPGLPTLATPDALRGLLTDLGPGEIFGKIHNGMISLGAFNIRASDSTHIHCDGFDPMTYEDFLTHFVGENSYLLQKRLENHSALNPYASGLATVRMINLVRENDIFTPFAIISMPQGDNIADTLWRSGNIACDIDVASGAIRTVVTREGPEIAFLPDHPATAGLMGMVLPHWDLLVETNARAARLFGPIKYQSTDIAITQDGPVIVELNYGSGFGLPQNASGRGLLTPEVVAFFEQHGATLGANAPAKKKGFFSRG